MKKPIGDMEADNLGRLEAELADLRQRLASLRRDLEGGLRFNHVVATRNQSALQAQTHVLNGLGHVLTTAGLVGADAVEQARRAYEEGQTQPRFRVRVAPDVDKYGPDASVTEVDCAERLDHCRGACCTQAFAVGTQDLDEGVVRWEYRDPYVNKRRADGRCVHQGDELSCQIWAQRPLFCRSYHCRNDARIWLDFERRIPNPALLDGPPDLSAAGDEDRAP